MIQYTQQRASVDTNGQSLLQSKTSVVFSMLNAKDHRHRPPLARIAPQQHPVRASGPPITNALLGRLKTLQTQVAWKTFSGSKDEKKPTVSKYGKRKRQPYSQNISFQCDWNSSLSENHSSSSLLGFSGSWLHSPQTSLRSKKSPWIRRVCSGPVLRYAGLTTFQIHGRTLLWQVINVQLGTVFIPYSWCQAIDGGLRVGILPFRFHPSNWKGEGKTWKNDCGLKTAKVFFGKSGLGFWLWNPYAMDSVFFFWMCPTSLKL